MFALANDKAHACARYVCTKTIRLYDRNILYAGGMIIVSTCIVVAAVGIMCWITLDPFT